MFGDESEWEEEEKNRIIGNADIYGKAGEGDKGQPAVDDINNDDITDGTENILDPEELDSEME